MYDQVAIDWMHSQGITPIVAGHATFDPYAYADPDARYNAWVAAGKPSRGTNAQFGEFELSNIGTDTQAGFRNSNNQALDAFGMALGDTSHPLLGESGTNGGAPPVTAAPPPPPPSGGSTPPPPPPPTPPVNHNPLTNGGNVVDPPPPPANGGGGFGGTKPPPATKPPTPVFDGGKPATPYDPSNPGRGPQLDGRNWLSPSDTTHRNYAEGGRVGPYLGMVEPVAQPDLTLPPKPQSGVADPNWVDRTGGNMYAPALNSGIVAPSVQPDLSLPPGKGGMGFTPTTPVMPPQQPQVPVATTPVMPPITPPVATTPVMPPGVQPPVTTTPVMPPTAQGDFYLGRGPSSGASPMASPGDGGMAQPFSPETSKRPAPSVEKHYADGGRTRPDAPLTLGDNGDVGPAVYMSGKDAASRYAILPTHSSVNETSEGHMFSDGSGKFAAGGRVKKRSGDADGTGIPPVGLADGGRIPYGEYTRRNQHPASFYQDAGVAPPADGGLPFSQAQWDALPLEQQYGNLGGDGTIVSQAGHNIAVNGVQGADGWVTVYGPPALYGHPASQWLDPSGLRDNGDGTFSFNPDKINGTRLAQYQQVDSDTGLGDGTHFAIAGIGTVVGGGLLAGAMGAGAAGAEGAGGAFDGAAASGGAGTDAFTGAVADGAASGNVFDGAIAGADGDVVNAFNGAVASGDITPEALAQAGQQNPSWWESVTQGAREAGSSVIDFLRANPALTRVGLSLVGAIIGGRSPHAPGANPPSGNGPPPVPPIGAVPPAGGAAGGGASGGAGLNLQNQLAQEFANNYRNVYLPQQQRTIDEANAIGGADDQARARERAVGDVANTYGAARGTILRNLARYGLGANSGQAQAGLSRAALEEAGARAGQSNVAVDRAITGGRTARANLLAMLNGTGSLASTGANAAAGTSTTLRGQDITSRGQDITQRGQDIGRELGLAGVNLNQQQLDANAVARRNAGYGSLIGNVGDWLFGKAQGGRIIDGEATQMPNDGEMTDATEGGAVQGPGTETSDDVPAKLSKGEIVINADSVKMIDEVAPGLLDKVNELGLKKRAMQSGVAYA